MPAPARRRLFAGRPLVGPSASNRRQPPSVAMMCRPRHRSRLVAYSVAGQSRITRRRKTLASKIQLQSTCAPLGFHDRALSFSVDAEDVHNLIKFDSLGFCLFDCRVRLLNECRIVMAHLVQLSNRGAQFFNGRSLLSALLAIPSISSEFALTASSIALNLVEASARPLGSVGLRRGN